MSEMVREKVLLEALNDIAQSGFTDAVLSAAAERAGVTKRELMDSFPHGPASLVEAFSHWADTRMVETMKSSSAERMRDRVKTAVRARIEALIPYKQAAQRAAAHLALPQNAALAARLTLRSVDLMWRAAGDRSSDFSYYTKRGLLAGVYGATLLFWLGDASEGNEATWAFLDHHINGVMQIEKLRSAAKDAIAKLPNPLEVLANLRGGRR